MRTFNPRERSRQVQRPCHISHAVTHEVVNVYTLTPLTSECGQERKTDTVGHSAVRNRFTDVNSLAWKGRRLIGAKHKQQQHSENPEQRPVTPPQQFHLRSPHFAWCLVAQLSSSQTIRDTLFAGYTLKIYLFTARVSLCACVGVCVCVMHFRIAVVQLQKKRKKAPLSQLKTKQLAGEEVLCRTAIIPPTKRMAINVDIMS